MIDILGMDEAALNSYITEKGLPAYRAKQVYDWLHHKLVRSFDEMKNVPKSLREQLNDECYLALPDIRRRQSSRSDDTNKFLFEFSDGSMVEAVLMKQSYGNSVCISSQVGCAMGCVFCASTLDGCERNLTAGEMLSEIYEIERILREDDERISHIVVMGTGEPLNNYDNLIRFIEIAGSKGGLNISKRNITVSTCGIVPGIKRLAEEGIPITLALSLHAPSQKKREEIMPIAKRYTIDEITDACEYYFEKTGRRVTIEYAMMRDKNDSTEDAKELSIIANKIKAHVNLIPLNEVKESEIQPTKREKIKEFASKLAKNKINVTIRKSMGADIDGACGQLRRIMKGNKL